MEESEAWRLTGGVAHEFGKGDPFAAAIRGTRMPMIITNPRQPDNPIVFANEAFLALSGYGRGEIMGTNCRFLQGDDTDPASVAAIRSAVRDARDIHVDILNYRKDGSRFWNALYLSPVVNEAGDLQFFFASQLDVTARIELQERISSEKARTEAEVQRRTRELRAALEAKTVLLHEVDHRVKNNLQMVASLIALQARRIPDPGVRQTLKSMLERVEALSTVHRRLYQSDDVSRFDVAEFVRDVSNDLVATSGREDIALSLELQSVEIPAAKAAPVALIVNEVITNAIKHAFPNRPGRITVALASRAADRFSIRIEDDGAGLPDTTSERRTLGMTLIENFGHQLAAEIEWTSAGPGTRVTITLPMLAAAGEG